MRETRCLMPHHLPELLNLFSNPLNHLVGSGFYYDGEDDLFFDLPDRIVNLSDIRELKRISRNEHTLELGSMLNLETVLRILRRERENYTALIFALEREISLSHQAIVTLYDLFCIRGWKKEDQVLALLHTHRASFEWLVPKRKNTLFSRKDRVGYSNLSEITWKPDDSFHRGEKSEKLFVRLSLPIRAWTQQISRLIHLQEEGIKFYLNLFIRIEEERIDDIQLIFYSSYQERLILTHWEETLLGEFFPLNLRIFPLLKHALKEDIQASSLFQLGDNSLLRLLHFLEETLVQLYLEENKREN